MSWQASGWALELYLGDARRKVVLLAIANYADHEGKCAFASLSTLAANCDLSETALRRRINELEQIGVINRFVRRIVAGGKIVSEPVNGRHTDSPQAGGKRTTDEFWVDLSMAPAAVETKVRELFDSQKPGFRGVGGAQASGNEPETLMTSEAPDITNSSPIDSAQANLACAPPIPLSPLHGGGGILPSDPRKIPPNPPLGGDEVKNDSGFEKRWEEFRAGYPDGILDPDKAKRALAVLSATDQLACVAALPTYADRLRRRREKSMKAHLFAQKRAWEGLMAAPTVGAMRLIEPASSPGLAILALASIGRYNPLMINGRLSWRGDLSVRLLAMAQAPPSDTWETYALGTRNFAAWRDFFRETFAGKVLPAITKVVAPWEWPPSADGTIYSGSDAPLIPGTMATEQDADEFTK